MNCTTKEFENKIFGVYPHKYMSLDRSPGPFGYSETLFALDTQGECQLPFASRLKLATHVWQDGSVIKDVNGLFGSGPVGVSSPAPGSKPQVSVGPAHISFNGVPIDFTEFSYELNTYTDLTKQELKCVCGAHSTGSNRHSNWCNIKETA